MDYNLLEDLVRLPGVSGREEIVRDRIIEEIEDLAPYEVDAMGNLSTSIGEGERELLIASHMDEIGMVVSHVTDDGYLRVRSVGGLDPRVVVGQQLRVIKADREEIPGAMGIKPPHLMTDRSEMKQAVPFEEMFLDIGASSANEVEAMGVGLLDPVVPYKQLLRLNNLYLSGRSLDDRLGCWLQIELLRLLVDQDLDIAVTLAWTVQEEVGLRGAAAFATDRRPDWVIPIDTLSSGDIPPVKMLHLGNAIPGRGPALRMIDNRAIGSSWLRDRISESAEEAGIPIQIAATGGGTDGAALQPTGAHMVPLAFPMRYTHGMCEMVHREDVEHMLALLARIPAALANP